MNILPLITGLLVLFFCLTSIFLRDTRSLSIAEWGLTAAARTERELRNTVELRHFQRVKRGSQKKSKPEEESPKDKKKGGYVSRRSVNPPIENSKLSLTPLFEGQVDLHNDPLYQIAERLLFHLYGHTRIVPKDRGWERKILDAMIRQHKALEETNDLIELFPEEPELKELYYKMLKGTNQYDFNTKKGIPPLGDFVTLEEEKKKNTIYLSFASPPLLKALFGEEVAEEILKTEKQEWDKTKKYHYISKEELEAILLLHHSAAANLASLDPYLNFSKKMPIKEDIAGQDTESGLVIKRKCL